MSPNIGHNKPPSEQEILKEKLQADHAKLLERAGKLDEASSRIAEITNEEDAAKVVTFISQINACKKELSDTHTKEKAPFLASGRVVDEVFKRKVDRLEIVKSIPTKFLNAWLKKKDDEAREAAAAEAKRLKEEADKRIADAALLEQGDNSKEAEKALTQAVRMDSQAQRFSTAAAGRVSLGVAKGADGASAGQRKVWTAEIQDIAAIDLEALRPYFSRDAIQVAANAFMRAGGRELKGVKIYEATSAVVR